MAAKKPRAGARITVSLSSIVRHFESLPDPRHHRNRRHLLGVVITIAVCGVIVGGDGPTALAQWAHAKKDWLKQFLELPNGIPSRDCIRRVLSALKPEAFQACFESWIASLITKGVNGNMIAIDGKTVRRSHDATQGLGPLHLVSAWATGNGLSLGQVATEEKSNEIKVIPELIDRIDVKGAVVTIDAMGCQKQIARRIIDAQGDYVLAVKDNQPTLHEAVRKLFSDESQAALVKRPHREHQSSEKGHGRKDDRYYVLAKLPADFAVKDQWPGAKAAGMVVRVTENRDGQKTSDVRYFISSCFMSGKRFAQSVRGHWSIENSLHWVLDVTFDEDQSRTRNRRMANNLAWLRRFAISLLKRHPATDSIKGKSRIAGWNNDFLMQVLIAKGI
ncbi:MAG: ISAs1 family transposase [Planctomycetes bacterium]|nr:ISAs1 family transposase [Planctomycetota bacterium]